MGFLLASALNKLCILVTMFGILSDDGLGLFILWTVPDFFYFVLYDFSFSFLFSYILNPLYANLLPNLFLFFDKDL